MIREIQMRTELSHVAASDRGLVVAARAGDKEAYAALLRRHRGLLLMLCRRVVGRSDVAVDVAQEASLQALLNLDRLRHPDRFGPMARRHRAQPVSAVVTGAGQGSVVVGGPPGRTVGPRTSRPRPNA
jgi:Sigma-70 region 2